MLIQLSGEDRLGETGGGGLAETPENNTPLSFHWHEELLFRLLHLSTPPSDKLLCQAGKRFQRAVKKGKQKASEWHCTKHLFLPALARFAYSQRNLKRSCLQSRPSLLRF